MKKCWIPVLIAAFAFLSGYAVAQNDSGDAAESSEKKEDPGEKAYLEGRRLFFLGRYDEAVELFRKAVAADEEKTVYKLYLAKSLIGADKAEEAEKIFLEILKENPEHVEAGIAVARIYEKAKKWKELIAVLAPILEYKHEYAIYHMLARACYNLPDLKKARMYYEKAIEQNPNSASDHYDLGNIYLGENRYALAAGAYEKCLALGFDADTLHYKLATAYSNLRNYLGAVSERVIKGGKEGMIKGGFYIIEAVPDKEDTFVVSPSKSAVFQVNRAIEMGITVPDILFLRANIWLGAGWFEKAYALYAELEKDIAEDEKALFHHQFAEAAFGLDRFDEFLKHTNEAIKLEPDIYKPTLVNAYLRVAFRKNQAGDLKGYIEYLDKAIQEKPDVASYHLLIANACRDAKDYPTAVKHWKLVLELEPEHSERIELLNLISKYSTAE